MCLVAVVEKESVNSRSNYMKKKKLISNKFKLISSYL